MTDDERLASEQNIWLATVRPNGRPHLVPIWFGYVDGHFYVCTWATSVKVRNVQANPYACVSLESGTKPLMAEGSVQILRRPFPEAVKAEFARKFDWDLDDEPEYDVVLEIIPIKWRRGQTGQG